MKKRLYLILLLLFLHGCATVSLFRQPVDFRDPSKELDIVSVEPTEEERAGVVLRLLAPASGVNRYREETVVFSQVVEEKGVKFTIEAERADKYSAGSRPDSYTVRSDAKIKMGGGKLFSELEVSGRGQIIRFIQGIHHVQSGRFIIEDWKRSAIFPEKAVKAGDAWNYTEVMKMRIRSPFVKESEGEPYIVKATNTLAGFATLRGVRCAVIESEALVQRCEHINLLFKDIILDIRANVAEKTYLDYKTGTVVAKITTVKSRANSPEILIMGPEESQGMTYLVK